MSSRAGATSSGLAWGRGSAEFLPLPGGQDPPLPAPALPSSPGSCLLPQLSRTRQGHKKCIGFSASVHAQAAPAPLVECTAGLSPARPWLQAEMLLVVQGPAVRGCFAPTPPSSCCLYQLFPAGPRRSLYCAPCLCSPPPPAPGLPLAWLGVLRAGLPWLLLLGHGAALCCTGPSWVPASAPGSGVSSYLPPPPCSPLLTGLVFPLCLFGCWAGECLSPALTCPPPSLGCLLPYPLPPPCCHLSSRCLGAGDALRLAGVGPAPSTPFPPPLLFDWCFSRFFFLFCFGFFK